MDYEYIKFATLKVLTENNIKSFPIKCFELLEHYGINIHSYSSLKPSLRKYCLSYSEDAFHYKEKLCYNDNMPEGRIRFSLMHELGHVILEHDQNHTKEMEQEANFFASHILAPRMAIHYAKCKNETDVAKLFGLTIEAAQYAFDDCRRWHRQVIYHKMDPFDKAIYSHFFNKDQDCFVYSIKECAYCDAVIYNSPDYVCKRCNNISRAYTHYQYPREDLLIAESQWLYGGL